MIPQKIYKYLKYASLANKNEMYVQNKSKMLEYCDI